MTKRAKIEPITRREAALRRGCSPATATRYFTGRGADAVLPDGTVDARHPAAARWIAAGQAEREAAGSDGAPTPDDLPTRADFLRVTFRRRAAEAESAERRNQIRAGLLIPREFVRHHMLGMADASLRRLLEVIPSIDDRVAVGIANGEPRETRTAAIERMVSHELGSLKRRLAQSLTRCEPTENPPAIGALNEATDDRADRQLRDFADALIVSLAGECTGRVVDMVAKVLARRACGTTWGPDVFDEAGLSTAARDEVTQLVRLMLRTAVDTQLRNATAVKESYLNGDEEEARDRNQEHERA